MTKPSPFNSPSAGIKALPVDAQAKLARLHARAWGVATGMLLGVGILVATLFLVIKGGENVGAHLGLLSIFMPGYSVSYGGAIIGFVYLFVVGYALGRVVSAVYNFFVRDVSG